MEEVFFDIKVNTENHPAIGGEKIAEKNKWPRMIRISNLNQILFYILLLLLCIYPAILLSTCESGNTFTNRNLAYAGISLGNGRFEPAIIGGAHFEPSHSAYEAMLVALAEVPHISLKSVQFLPLGGMLIPLCYFALCRKLFEDRLVLILLVIYIAYDLSQSAGLYGTQAYSFGRPLYLVFLIAYLHFITDKKNTSQICILLLVFTSTFLIASSIALWMIFFCLLSNILLLVRSKSKEKRRANHRLTLNITLVFIIIYLTFSRMLYDVFIPITSSRLLTESPLDLFLPLQYYLRGGKAVTSEEYLISGTINPALYWARLLIFIVILIPIVFYLGRRLFAFVGKKGLKSHMTNKQSFLVWPAIGTAIGHLLIYSMYGHPSFRYVLFIFPVTALICLHGTGLRKKVRIGLLIAILILSIAGFSFAYTTEYNDKPRYATLRASTMWLMNALPLESEEVEILTDMDTSGKYLVSLASRDLLFEARYYTSQEYKEVVNPNYLADGNRIPQTRPSYVIINLQTSKQPVSSVGWKYYEPLSQHLDKINDNLNLQKIYDDDHVWTLGK